MPGGALQQAHAQTFFQRGNSPAEFGLGGVQGTAGWCKAAVFDYLGEVVEVVEVFHDRSPNGTVRAI
ncbi:hypothetical protein D3C78_1928450 [compost metagenome]